MSLKLKAFLLNSYGSFSDKRIKKLESGNTFTIDDRQPRDENSRGNLYPYFCMMFARVVGEDALELNLERNAPLSSAVEQYVKSKGGTVEKVEMIRRIILPLRPSDGQVPRELARRMRLITAPGVRYEEKNYKYVVPRTAKSLERFADILDRYCTSPDLPEVT